MLGRILLVGTASAIFDPSTLSLTGWWRASYGGTPWSPTSSAGTSGSDGSLTTGVAPSVGTAVNSLTPATFNGTTQYLVNSNAISTFFDPGGAAGSIAILFNASSAASDGGAPYTTNPGLMSSAGGGYLIIGYSTSGLDVAAHQFSGYTSLSGIAAATGAWHLAQIKWDGSSLNARVDSGSWSSTSFGSIDLMSETLQVGSNLDNTKLLAGSILEVMTAATSLSNTTFDNIKSYMNNRYALSL